MRLQLTIKPGGWFVTDPRIVGISDRDVELVVAQSHPKREELEFIMVQAAITLNNTPVQGTC